MEKVASQEMASQTSGGAKQEGSATEMSEAQLTTMHREISQIKAQYEEKLRVAIEDGEVEQDKLKAHKDATVKQFESVINMEFEKILLSLRVKSQNLGQEQLD